MNCSYYPLIHPYLASYYKIRYEKVGSYETNVILMYFSEY